MLTKIASAQSLLPVGSQHQSKLFHPFLYWPLTASVLRHVGPGTCASCTASMSSQPLNSTPHSSFNSQDAAFGLPFPLSSYQTTSYAPPKRPTIFEDVSSKEDVGTPAFKPQKRGLPARAEVGPKSKSKQFPLSVLFTFLFHIYSLFFLLLNHFTIVLCSLSFYTLFYHLNQPYIDFNILQYYTYI